MPRRCHVILADDDPIVHAVFAVHFAKALPSITLSSASDGVEALSIYHEHGADLILSDCFMPNMSGLILALRLREEGAKLPIVLMSSSDTFEGQAKFAGATAFVLKQPPQLVIQTITLLLEL